MKEKDVKPAETGEPEITLAQVLDRLAAIQEGNQRVQREQLKQTASKSKARAPNISPYNPRGEKDYPMPELKCTIHMPFRQRPADHGLDREEVELFNLLQPGNYRVTLNDESTLTIAVVGRINRATGKIEEMYISGPLDPDSGQHTPLFTKETKQLFPGLRTMLREMLGEAADDVLPIKVEQQQVNAFLKLDEQGRELALLDPAVTIKHATAAHRGPLAVSIGE